MKLKIIFIILILLLFSCLLAEIEELFFSEYIEGSSYNKALEIYNGTGVTVDLTNYQLWQVANGGNWYEYIIDFPPGAYIADGDVYVVCHEEADAIILAVADLVVTLYHNGNDAQGLAKDDGTGTFYLIDTIGEEGTDPGDGWAVAGINNATKDHTLVRKSTVEAPTTDWALSAGTNPSDSQWEVYAINTFDYIGFHVAGADINPPTLISAIALSSSSVEITFSEVVTPGTAENSENYFISELPITSAVLQGNGITVTLTTSEQNPGQSYTIVVNNIEDLAENVIATDSEISFSGYQIIEMELFFSEYIEGSSNNKALEIYNGTGAAVNLAGYEIWRISNGGDWAEGESNAVSLEGILENNDVYVICNSNANAEIQAVSDLIGTTATYYNGNDAVGLAHNGILIDAIGEEGPDVGIAWDVAGTTEATLNHTLVRKPDILQGNMNWALSAGTNTENSEWFVYNEDTFDYLGYHSVSGEDTYPPIMTSAFATSITSVEISFNEALDETTSEDITNYSIDPFLDLSSASLGTNKVTLTTSEQTEEENYTITVNNVEDLAENQIEAESTINFTGYSGTQYDLIADIQADPSSYEGQTVTICGIVTIGVNVIQTGNTNAYVQDNSERGINIYDSSVINELERGNLVEITGQVTQYNDTTEIIDPVVTVLSTGNPEPEPLDFYLGDASDFELEGTLLRVKGEIIDVWSAGGGTNIEIEDDEDNEITVRVWDTTGLNLSEYVEGFNLQAVGIGDVFSEMQIVPGYQDQLSEAQDIEENVTTDPENPLAGEEVTVTYTSPDPLENALLFWKTSGDLEYEYIEMDSVGQRDISYQCVIPGQSQGTVVYYYLVITDTTGESYSIPENAPDDDVMSYSYKVTSLKAILNIPAKPFDPYAGEKFPIEFATETGNKAILRIYNAEGKLVLTPKNIIVPHPGICTYEWDGRDKNHKLLPLGLYICYQEVVDTDTGKKKSAKAPIVIGAPLK